jgi:ribonuclease P protein component
MQSDESAGVQWISKSRDIKSLRRTGRFFRGRMVLIWVSPSAIDGGGAPFVGIVAGRGFGNAVRRNLARRRVRGCLMDMRHLLRLGTSYLVECRPGVEEVDYQFLVIEMQSILLRSSNCGIKNQMPTGGGR